MEAGKRIIFEVNKQKEFLIESKEKMKMNYSELSKFLGVSRGGLRSWLNEECSLPSDIFIKMTDKLPELKIYEKYVRKILDKNWGVKKGGISRVKKVKDIYKFMEHVRSNKINIRTSKLPFPASDYITELMKKEIKPIYLLATMIMTDGSLCGNSINYSSVDITLRNIIVDILCLCSKKKPSIYLTRNLNRIYLNDSKLVKKLIKLSPSFKTCPSNKQSIKDYLKEPQPAEHLKTLAVCGTIIF